MKGKINLNLFLLFIVLFNFAYSQTTNGVLRGIVRDAETGEVLPYCNAFIKTLNKGAATDSRGYFIITNIPPKDNYQVTISYMGYQSQNVSFVILSNKTTDIDVKLKQNPLELSVVEKVANRVQESNATDIGLQKITIKQLEALPKGVETDVLRALQYIPGVRSRGDISAKYYVRGSSANQNLLKLNGATLYNPYHALGIFSVIDPEVINSVEFFKGGFTAEHGGRLSSVLNIITKDGNRNNYSGQVSASMLTGKLLAEGPIMNGSFMITGRKTISNKIMDKFLNDNSIPIDFYDLTAKLNFENAFGTEKSKLVLHSFLSRDDLKYNDNSKEDYYWKNGILGMRWFQLGDVPLYFDIGITYISFEGEIIPNLSNVRQKYNEIKDFTIDANYSYVYNSKNELSIGLEIKDIETTIKVENSQGIKTDLTQSGMSMSLFGKFKFLEFDNIGIDFGTRFNLVRLVKRENNISAFEPRINATYQVSPLLKLKASYGIYQQDMTTMENENEILTVFEPWFLIPDYLKTSYSNQLAGGITFNLNENFEISLEAYYKTMKNLPIANFAKKFADEKDFVSGSGESYGSEIQIIYQLGESKLSLSYAHAYAYKELNGWVYYPGYDARNTFNSSLDYNFGKGWSANLTWVYSSGTPFTKIQSLYPKMDFSDIYLRDLYQQFKMITILDDINLGRLPDYHRLDLNVTKAFNYGFISGEINFSVLNLYDRKNIFYFERTSGKRVNMLPVLPSVGLKVKI